MKQKIINIDNIHSLINYVWIIVIIINSILTIQNTIAQCQKYVMVKLSDILIYCYMKQQMKLQHNVLINSQLQMIQEQS